MDAILQDLRYGFRMLRRSAGATAVAVICLALGIGATTAIFTVINAALLRPLPFRDSDKLVVLWEQNVKRNLIDFDASPPNYRDWTERSKSFATIAALRPGPATLIGSGQPERVEIARVTPTLFQMLGVNAIEGRTFIQEDADPARGRVVILSSDLWQRRFGSDPGILGKSITLDNASYTVIGVAGQNMKLFNMASELWIPYVLDSEELSQRGFHTLKVIGRLKPGATIEQAQSEMSSIAGHLETEFPEANSNWGVKLVSLRQQITGNFRQPLWILLGAVGLVLLIACTNVASILLMKAGARHKELAIRSTLGASPARVIGQMLAESLVLSSIAAIVGVALAWAFTRLLVYIAPPAIAELRDLTIDWRVLLFAVAAAVCTGILFGLVPGLAAIRTNLNGVLRSSGRSGMTSAGWSRARSVLVVAELMLAQVLLIGAGLLIHSLVELRSVPLGFHPDHVVSMRLALSDNRYKDMAVGRFYERLLDRVTPLPGVQHAAITRDLPLSGANPSLNFEVEGRSYPSASEQPRARFRIASTAYFAALGIPIAQGRVFERNDSDRTQAIAVINESLARREWPNQNPIGRRLRSGFDGAPWCTVVGIVHDVKHSGLDAKTDAEIYYHYLQVPAPLMYFTEGSMTLVLRTEGDPVQIVNAVRAEVAALDSTLALYSIRTADELISGSIAEPRFRTVLLVVFASTAMLLAAIGLYGLLASSVVQRTSELGIRAALGATIWDQLSMILSQGLALALVGVAAGTMLGFGFSRVLAKLLFGITPGDWLSFTVTPVVLLGIALLASLIPALRATRIDPAIALREQ